MEYKYAVRMGIVILVLSLIVFSMFIWLMWLMWLTANTVVPRKTCSDFKDYESAYKDYKNGNTTLDGGKGTKGVPCESLLKNVQK